MAASQAKSAPAGQKKQRSPRRVKPLKNPLILICLTLFQVMTAATVVVGETFHSKLCLLFALFIGAEWLYYLIFALFFKRRNFELEFIAFLLSGIGLVTISSIDPGDATVQFLSILLGLAVFVGMVWFMGDVERLMKLRLPMAGLAILALVVNLVISKSFNGAKNWIEIFGVTIQPSEFVKVAFVFVGAATLEKLQATQNLWAYLAFACACIGCLFLMRDFGTACIFFFTFLILAFMRSGDIRTIILMCTAGGLGALMILRFKPYVAQRFTVYRHVWEHAADSGYQQTRVLVGLASGGLFGVGIGNGIVKHVFASSTDLVFGVICEEWGLIFGVSILLVLAGLVVSALKNSIASRSAFYSIAACAAAGLLLFQACLNVFGITDILPLTGVTLPFISKGGSSMVACWGLLAFIKASDVRTYNNVFSKGGARA